MEEESTAPARADTTTAWTTPARLQRGLATGCIDGTWWRTSRTASLEERLARMASETRRATSSSGEEQWLRGTRPATRGRRGTTTRLRFRQRTAATRLDGSIAGKEEKKKKGKREIPC
ncbi:hypothetical protein Scep_001992 [Stephania cephalantha]|uniref:Uncharacterized protein n=1 Tax=Stephania cephalantha TaxID=152367 RepID=A0AAP0L9H0_9MAGN